MTRLYRWLLIAYPAPLRRTFGRDMVELYTDLVREQRRDRGRLAALRVGLRAVCDLPFSAAAAWRATGWRALRASPSGKAARSLTRTGSKTGASAASRSMTAKPTARASALSGSGGPAPRGGPGGAGWLDGFGGNLRYAWRNLRRQPGFVAVVVLTLAVGIGANTVMFTVLDGILLSPLPYPEADRLVRLYVANPERWSGNNYVQGPMFLALRERTEIFETVAAAYSYRQTGVDITRGEGTERIVVMPVSSGYFETVGVAPLLGRGFLQEEELEGITVAVISHGLWQRAFGGDAGILGRDVDLEGVLHTVVGVMPAGFRNPIEWQVDAWLPQELHSDRNSWGNYYLSVIGRLREGVSLPRAQEQLEALGRQMFEENPETYGGYGAIYPLLDDTVGDTAPMLWMLMAAVTMVLLIVCVNVAGLYLVRNAGRARELAVRAALGAGRRSLAGQMLLESLLLGVVGGAAGLLLSIVGLRLVIALSPDSLPRINELGIDGRVFAFACGVSVITGLLFGVAPALRHSRPRLESTLREDTRGGSGGRQQQRLRMGLVVAEIALALVLLFGAGLLIKSFDRLVVVDLGVPRGGILTYEVHLPPARYPEAQDRVAFYDRYFEQVEGIAGVEAVGATSYLPTEGRYHIWGMGRADQDLDDNASWTGTDVRVIDGDYLDIMGIDAVRGRLFSAADPLEPPYPALISESLAELAFPDRDPLGAEVETGGDAFRIVGVVRDVSYDTRGTTSPHFYVNHDHFAGDRHWAMIQTVRTAVAPASITGQLRAALDRIDPQLVLYRVRTFEEVLAGGISPQRFATALMSGFAVVAVLLAAIGIYGVLSQAVAQRRREIGIRMALGADRGAVRGMVLRQALLLTGFGLVLGIAGALSLTGWLSSLLFQVEPADVQVLAAVVATLAGVALLAGYLPARRATAVDPLRALTDE